MQDSFYRNFLEEGDKIVAFIGGGGKSTLMQRLSRDCLYLKKKVVILSLHPMVSPLEANILLSDNPSSIDQQVKKEFTHSNLLYIGKKLTKGTIENFFMFLNSF